MSWFFTPGGASLPGTVIETIRGRAGALRSGASFWSLRYVEEESEALAVRDRVVQPPRRSRDRGAMLTAVVEGGWGYAATLHRVLTDITHPVYVPGFERTLEQPIAANRCIAPGPALVVTEGNYLLDTDAPWQAARRLLAEVWFAETPAPLRHERLVARHVAFGKTQGEAEAWVAAVDEPNAERIRSAREAADLIVPVA